MEENSEENAVHMRRSTEISRVFSTYRNPTKRQRCREDASLVCNLKNPKSLKSARSNETWDSYDMALVKHGRREENSVKDGIHFEKQDWKIELSSSEPTSSTSIECDSSANDSKDLESDEVSQTSGVVDGKKLKLRTGRFNTFKKTKTISENGSYDINDEDEMGLIYVHVTLSANCRAENVPFVCLTSKLDGKAVLGHPVEIEELKDSSETLIPKLFDEEGSRLDRLVWRTFRRTPVCYVKTSVYSVSGNLKSGQASKNGLVPKDGSLHQISSQFKKGRTQPKATCVPVERIFGKILAAVGPL